MHASNPTPPATTVPERIVLTGFMGAGKSTVGRTVAERLGWEFVDLDDVIVEAAGKSIAELFDSIGEAAFREQEHRALHSVLARSRIVLALGGGAIETAANRDLLRNSANTCVVYLEAPLGTLLERCQQQQAQPGAAVRPVLADLENLLQRFTLRLPHYRTAHHTVRTTGKDPASVAEELLRKLQIS
jgi:shikimate kinase